MGVRILAQVRVLCLVPYPSLGASNRLRVEQYAPLLKQFDIELVVSSFYDEAVHRLLYDPGRTTERVLGVLRGFGRRMNDILNSSRFDLALVHRESAPFGPPFIEKLLLRRGVRYVFDFDDAIFLPAVHPVNRRWAWLRRPSRVVEVARNAAAVIAGNEYLADWARRWNSNVTIIPTPVDTERHIPRSTANDRGPVVIGWVGSSTTAPYLRILDEPLAAIAKRLDVVMRVVGGKYANPSVRVDERPYLLEREPADVASFDIGVLPEPDDEWTRGKCAFKALLYMATGLPVVASSVGINPEVIQEGVTGFCVRNAGDWVVALERLISDRSLRVELGRNGRGRVLDQYSVQVQAPRLAGVLRGVARIKE
jgi:glycosyltransferase involved in cell wall biosynthesis